MKRRGFVAAIAGFFGLTVKASYVPELLEDVRYIVTAACLSDDVIVGVFETREQAEARKAEVLKACSVNEYWLKESYGYLASNIGCAGCQTVSELVEVRIFEACGERILMVDRLSVEKFEEANHRDYERFRYMN